MFGPHDTGTFNKMIYLKLITMQIQEDVGNFRLSDKEIEFFTKHYFKRKVDAKNWK